MSSEREENGKRNYKYQQVSQAIIQKIASNEWRVGEKIPPEAELCQMIQVSRVTLRESLKALSILGILDIVQGDGTYVREVSPASVIEPLLPLLQCSQVHTREVYLARQIVEGGACELAAIHRSEEDLRYLHDLIEDMQEAITMNRFDLFSEADRKFHQKINNSSGNAILAMICNMFSELVKYYIGKINEDASAIDNSMLDHIKIYEAIRDQRPEFARIMMSEHLRVSMQYLVQNDPPPKIL